MPNDTFICAHCGVHQPVWERTLFDGQALCTDCLSAHTTLYSHCGTRIWNSDNAGTEDTPLCHHCYSSIKKSIQNYHYKPSPIFYGEGNRFFRVELEIDGAGERDSAAEQLILS